MTVQTVPATRTVPTSFTQRRLWLLDQMASGNTAYNLVAALRLRGALDVAGLRKAVQHVVDRHDSLRTTFTEIDGEPYQVIAAEVRVNLPMTDLTDVDDPFGWARDAVERDVARAFDLAAGPLIRTSLLRLDDDDHVLTVICHHSISDGWSMGLVLDEISAAYSAHCLGEPLPESTPVQFGEHAEWEREQLTGDRLRKSLDHWRGQLSGAPELLDLPTSHPRPPVQGFDGATHHSTLSPELWDAVRELARQQRATPFMVLLSVFGTLLSRLSGADDIVIGTPVAGRTRPELHGVVGMFVNTLPLRVKLSGSPSLLDLLKRVRRTVLGSFRHQDVPLERLVAELAPSRATSHDPLYQTMFALQPPVGMPTLHGVTAELFPVATSTVFTDLWLEIRPGDDGVDCALRYRTELFDAEAIERIARQYTQLLAGALAAPDAQLSRLPLLDDQDNAEILDEWSRGGAARPWTRPVHEVIDECARTTPDATAIIFDGERLTYAGLAGRAGTVARHLAASGVAPESVVALCLERSFEMVTSIVGVLSAGCAYLPLSPSDPPARLAELLTASGARHVLATRETAAALVDAGVPVTLVDELGVDVEGRVGVSMVTAEVGPEQLAYVIYTSGSTGKPKAVGVPHRGLANRLMWMPPGDPLTADERVMHKTPYTFDVSIWELLWPLTVGAALVVAAPGGHRDPAYLVDLVERESVTTIHFVPPMLEGFLGEPDLHRCGSLRRVICSGQALPGALRDRCLQRLSVRLYNLYGPTEASIEVTAWECRLDPDDPAVPIGRPITGVQTYILDAELQPTPSGVTGELYLGGNVLAWGYLGQPGLTADRFVPHPYADRPGERLYRTGDLVRWRSDGTIVYIGRNDHQLKVRGFRIEPGEIENVVRTHTGVRDTVVAAKGTGLVGYLVPDTDGDPDELVSSVRESLRARLPEHMVPARFVVLPELPLGPTGKVDVKALPEPAAGSTVGVVAPRNGVELTLASIWSEVLGRDVVSINEDFFEAGGDSLKCIRVVHRAQESGLTLRVADIFRNPTISGLAARLQAAAS